MGYAPICVMPQCPEKSCVRVTDKKNTRRLDLCMEDAIVAIDMWGESIVVIDTWNGTTTDSLLGAVKTYKEIKNHAD